MSKSPRNRAFSVRARDLVEGHSRLVSASSFEAAAVAWAEGLHAVADGAEISVMVRDIDSGHLHCFRIDLESGAASACVETNQS